MLNEDIIRNILSYSGNMRILKIKMNIQNMKYLFETNYEMYDYLYKKRLTCYSSFGEILYLKLISLLHNKNIKMNDLYDNLMEEIKIQPYAKYTRKSDMDFIVNTIINDYNNYYLVDKYYYDGYWLDDIWYSHTINDFRC